MLECVPNVSEGRARASLDAFAAACGPSLLDVHRDVDHHRSVFTLAGPGPRDAERAVRALAREVVDRIDLERHEGVHPRLGALDVVPFVALDGSDPATAVEAAHAFGAWAVDELGTPVFFYGFADERDRTLPSVRASAFRTRAPDLVPQSSRAGVGAIAVGARPVLVAINCELDRDDLALARTIASTVRERDGGLPGVRALGLRLASREHVQVSMNLVALDQTGVQAACETVRARAHDRGAAVTRVELVGLVPAAELDRCTPEFLEWSGLDVTQTIEHRLTH
ncbi:MAG TPA: glutamate formiminotransferase [Acidimicrobiia bacterium]|nr:glutamate formiminotransferase [Acidimicrobiia bacterium]